VGHPSSSIQARRYNALEGGSGLTSSFCWAQAGEQTLMASVPLNSSPTRCLLLIGLSPFRIGSCEDGRFARSRAEAVQDKFVLTRFDGFHLPAALDVLSAVRKSL
jgi:hypothetical protein